MGGEGGGEWMGRWVFLDIHGGFLGGGTGDGGWGMGDGGEVSNLSPFFFFFLFGELVILCVCMYSTLCVCAVLFF